MKKYIYDEYSRKYYELIECKDCRYYRDDYNDWDICSLYDKPRYEDDYCSRGEKNEKSRKK